jgi:AcrR family transcriptional regulator
MPAKRPDRRVERTHHQLRAALLSLMQERGFEELSVQDIIDRANVGRATFYAHFENKEDLLVSGIEDFRETLRHQRGPRRPVPGKTTDAFLFSHELFAHVAAHRDIFRPMVGKHSGAVVQRLFGKILLDLVREDVKAIAAPDSDRTAAVDAAVQFVAAGLLGLLAWWVDARRSLSVEEMEAMFRRMAAPAIEAVLR